MRTPEGAAMQPAWVTWAWIVVSVFMSIVLVGGSLVSRFTSSEEDPPRPGRVDAMAESPDVAIALSRFANLTVEAADDDEPEIDVRAYGVFAEASKTVTASDGRTDIDVSCRAALGSPCVLQATVRVPQGRSVSVDGQWGEVSVAGSFTRLAVAQRLGDVRTKSPVSVGEVSVSGGLVSANMEFATPPDAVTMTTESGDLIVALPDDGSTYAVSAASDDGVVEVPDDDPTSSRRLSLHTEMGSIRVSPNE